MFVSNKNRTTLCCWPQKKSINRICNTALEPIEHILINDNKLNCKTNNIKLTYETPNKRTNASILIRIFSHICKGVRRKPYVSKYQRQHSRKRKHRNCLFCINQKNDESVEKFGFNQMEKDSANQTIYYNTSIDMITVYPLEPTKLDNFEILQLIGKGGYSEVFQVLHKPSSSTYAMKKLSLCSVITQGLIKQTEDEVNIQKLVGEHPFILQLVDTWQSEGFLYQLLPYIKFGDLFTLWKEVKRFPLACVALCGMEIATALDFMHGCNVIYRDLKMENILIQEKGHVLLSDFGLSKAIKNKTYTVCGTLKYMAPEIAIGSGYSFHCDWWSLGVLIVALATGKFPYQSLSDHKEMLLQIRQKASSLSQMTNEPMIKEVINKVLHYHHEHRVTSLEQFYSLQLCKSMSTKMIEKEYGPFYEYL